MALQPLAQSLLDCVLVTLTDAGYPPCTSYLTSSPTPAFDSCCLCSGNKDGQLWVALIGVEPRDPFRGQPCGRDFQVEFRVGLTRCTHTVQDDGTAPTPAQIQESAEKMYRDRQLVLQAITCCWAGETLDLDPMQWAIGAFETLPNQGGCQAFLQSVVINTPDCSDC